MQSTRKEETQTFDALDLPSKALVALHELTSTPTAPQFQGNHTL